MKIFTKCSERCDTQVAEITSRDTELVYSHDERNAGDILMGTLWEKVLQFTSASSSWVEICVRQNTNNMTPISLPIRGDGFELQVSGAQQKHRDHLCCFGLQLNKIGFLLRLTECGRSWTEGKEMLKWESFEHRSRSVYAWLWEPCVF